MTTVAANEIVPATPATDDRVRAAIAGLEGRFAGQVISPDHPDYESARAVWNAMVDHRPALILRCTSTSDVVAAVDVARRVGLPPAVRAGGHNVAGKGMSDGGLTIDLSLMRDVVVHEDTLEVEIAGGCQLGDVDRATGPLGLVVPAGIMSETGVGGLALGGGIGWFSRKHGLTCDQFRSLEVVLADGSVVTASGSEHPDLFWALRGGGGNFGIVTRFTVGAHRFGPLMRVGVALYHPTDAREALQSYGRILPGLSRLIGWQGALKHDMGHLPFVPPELLGKRMLMLITMWQGDADDPEGMAEVERLTRVGNPATRAITVLPFGAGVQHLIDADFPDGHRYYTKEAHFSALPDDAIDRLLDFWLNHMEMEGEVELIHLGGAIRDVAEDDAAFAHREYELWVNFAMRWDDPAKDADHIAATRTAIEELKPWTGTGLYYNMINFDEGDRVIEALGGPEKYARLGRVKATYDPHNLFRHNYNIVPVS